MKIERQTELRKVLSPVALPKMAVIEQHFPDDAIQDVPAYLRERLMPEHIRSRIQPGMKVVLTGSSRQIHDMPVVLRELASFVKEQGAQPYIIPAMGSHAGGIAEKQKELLEGYGITEAFCGCPIYSSMETVQVGALDNGDEVRVDRFAHAADAVNFGRTMKVAMLGNNMRDVAVTDGDRVESEIRYGWNVNYYGIGDIVDIVNDVTDDEIDAKLGEYSEKYTMTTDNISSVREQAKYELALEKFIARENIGAFTDTFQDLHGLKQLPGIAAQNLMAKGIGFGPEGDYKTAALGAVLFKMAEGRKGATGFMEDYTYDLTRGSELELAAHMLEVSPVFAEAKPEIQVHPLGIGGKEDPARLVFDGISGEGIAVSMIDLGDRFRLVCADITLVKQPAPMPKLPVARLMWKLKPDFATGAAAWIYAGGAHHAVVSTALTKEDIRLFAKMTDTELVIIDDKTDINAFEQQLAMLDATARLKR